MKKSGLLTRSYHLIVIKWSDVWKRSVFEMWHGWVVGVSSFCCAGRIAMPFLLPSGQSYSLIWLVTLCLMLYLSLATPVLPVKLSLYPRVLLVKLSLDPPVLLVKQSPDLKCCRLNYPWAPVSLVKLSADLQCCWLNYPLTFSIAG